ncbi:MAG: serine hydrolase [Bacteroidota bacterium]
MLRSPGLVLLLTLAACTAPDDPPAPPPFDLDARVDLMLEAYGVEGVAVAVVRDQETVLANGYGFQQDGTPYTAESVHQLYSATKAVASFVYASLVEDAAFDLDAPLGELLPDAPDAWAGLPFWRLLNHTSGIPMVVTQPGFQTIYADTSAGNPEVYAAVRDVPLDFVPGETSRYQQSGYAIAELILEHQLGSDWPSLVEAHVTGPAGTDSTVHTEFARGQRSVPLIASGGGFQTTASDMARVFKALNDGRIASPEGIDSLLHQDAYRFESYSLGSILEEIDGMRTVGHQGGGARATIRYAPNQRIGVAVFTNDTDNNNLTLHLADQLVRAVALGQEPLPPISALLLEHRQAPADSLVQLYQTEAGRDEPQYDFALAEWTLNRLGYQFLRQGQTEDALILFALNARTHPGSANTHDSLGEAYVEAGDPERALASYRRALELNPESQNAQQMIGRIQAGNQSPQ